VSPPFSCCLGRAGGSEDTTGITKAEAVALTCLVTDVTGVEVAFKTSFDCNTLEHLHAVRSIRLDEEGFRIGQVVVHSVALGNHAHVAEGIDVVVRCTNTEGRLHDAICSELEFLRNDQLDALNSNLKATLVREGGDVNKGLLKGGLAEVSRRGELVL
jgi:hypothetical protein